MDEAPFQQLLFHYVEWLVATHEDLIRFLQGPLRPRLLAWREAGAARDPRRIAMESPPAATLTALTACGYLPWWIQEPVLEDSRTGAPILYAICEVVGRAPPSPRLDLVPARPLPAYPNPEPLGEFGAWVNPIEAAGDNHHERAAAWADQPTSHVVAAPGVYGQDAPAALDGGSAASPSSALCRLRPRVLRRLSGPPWPPGGPAPHRCSPGRPGYHLSRRHSRLAARAGRHRHGDPCGYSP